MAMTPPTRAQRTGAAVRPRPRSRANCAPATADTGSPDFASTCTVVRAPLERPCAACRHGGVHRGTRSQQAPTARTQTSSRKADAEHRPVSADVPDRGRRDAPALRAREGRGRRPHRRRRSTRSTIAPVTPMRPSRPVIAGPAPIARRTSRSSSRALSWRAIAWMARRSAASPAIPPNTPRASASGLIDCSASACIWEATRKSVK